MPLSNYCYREEIKSFIDSIINRKSMYVMAEDGLKALKIAEATLRSYKEKKVIKIDEL